MYTSLNSLIMRHIYKCGGSYDINMPLFLSCFPILAVAIVISWQLTPHVDLSSYGALKHITMMLHHIEMSTDKTGQNMCRPSVFNIVSLHGKIIHNYTPRLHSGIWHLNIGMLYGKYGIQTVRYLMLHVALILEDTDYVWVVTVINI